MFINEKGKQEDKEVQKDTDLQSKTENNGEKVEEKVENDAVETKTETKTDEKVDETDKSVENNEENAPQETEMPQEQPIVNQVAEEGNAIPISEVVLKSDLQEALASLNAKLEALANENKQLTDKLAEKDTQINGYKEKYEANDFGNFAPKGVQSKDKIANESFETYAKQFM